MELFPEFMLFMVESVPPDTVLGVPLVVLFKLLVDVPAALLSGVKEPWADDERRLDREPLAGVFWFPWFVEF